MLSPLARQKNSNRSSDITSDFEGPISADEASYIGKKKNSFFFVCIIFSKIISVELDVISIFFSINCK
jgi:hypothetical protein